MSNRLFKRLFLGFGTTVAILIPGLSVARANAKMINHALNIKDYKVINVGDDVDPSESIYFKSDYHSVEEVKAAGEKLVEEVEASGLVLLQNKNSASPGKG